MYGQKNIRLYNGIFFYRIHEHETETKIYRLVLRVEAVYISCVTHWQGNGEGEYVDDQRFLK